MQVVLLVLELIRTATPPPAGQRTAAVLLRGALDERQQSHMYNYLVSLARGSVESRRLAAGANGDDDNDDDDPRRPLPLAVWRHPYTLESNVAEPSLVLEWARKLAATAAEGLGDADDACAVGGVEFDSLVSVLYRQGDVLPPHVDHGLADPGLAVTLGGACDFFYGGTRVRLASGDALFGAFGTVEHDVRGIRGDAAPDWFKGLPADSPRGGCSFGRARCSVQLRRARRL